LVEASGLTALLAQLVSIDSQNPELVPGAAGERPIAEFCVDWLTRAGVEAWTDELDGDRCNAVARVSGGSGPTVALCAHLDTVSAEGVAEAFEPRVENGRLYGRGAYDMKGGVAAVMAAMAALARRPPRGTVLAALVADEEYASAGATAFVGRYPVDACIVTEPSEGRLILAHKGFVWLELETAGVPAHGSRWEDGDSSIARMARVVAALADYDVSVLRRRTHPLLGPASLHCSMISGGTGWSTYAGSCVARIERRTLPGETPAQVMDEISAVAAAAGEEVRVREVLVRSPLECPADSAIADAARRAVEELTGAAPETAGVAYWMDAAIFADAGAATVNYGPGGGGAHAEVEWVELVSVVRCAQVLENAVHRYCADDMTGQASQ
jgi:acetylornithine deacetylase